MKHLDEVERLERVGAKVTSLEDELEEAMAEISALKAVQGELAKMAHGACVICRKREPNLATSACVCCPMYDAVDNIIGVIAEATRRAGMKG